MEGSKRSLVIYVTSVKETNHSGFQVFMCLFHVLSNSSIPVYSLQDMNYTSNHNLRSKLYFHNWKKKKKKRKEEDKNRQENLRHIMRETHHKDYHSNAITTRDVQNSKFKKLEFELNWHTHKLNWKKVEFTDLHSQKFDRQWHSGK